MSSSVTGAGPAVICRRCGGPPGASGRDARRTASWPLPDAAPGDRRQHVRRGLHRDPLHVVQDAADPAELLTAAGPTRPAVDEARERRAVAGRLGGVVAVEHEQPPVPGRQAEDEVRATSRSFVTSEPTRLPLPRAARVTTSASEP